MNRYWSFSKMFACFGCFAGAEPCGRAETRTAAERTTTHGKIRDQRLQRFTGTSERTLIAGTKTALAQAKD